MITHTAYNQLLNLRWLFLEFNRITTLFHSCQNCLKTKKPEKQRGGSFVLRVVYVFAKRRTEFCNSVPPVLHLTNV